VLLSGLDSDLVSLESAAGRLRSQLEAESCGRRFYGARGPAGFEMLGAGSSDWNVFPTGGRYAEGTALFLKSLLGVIVAEGLGRRRRGPPCAMLAGTDTSMDAIVGRLLGSAEASVRWKARRSLLGESPDSRSMRSLAREVHDSPLARRLLTVPSSRPHPYQKWQGPHFTLICLAEIGYPPGDTSLMPLRDRFYDWLFAEHHFRPPHTLVLPGQEDRVRRCAGQEGYAVWYSLALGLADARTEALVERLLEWQWPDGGWNCDKRPQARASSFHESLIPLRALSLHGALRQDRRSLAAAARAAEIFLERGLFRARRTGEIIHPDFVRLQYPHFYPYNILFGLRVMAEAGFIRDPRCREALDLLESKRLPDGGFPLEKKNWTFSDTVVTRGTFADWGPSGKQRMNEFVTVDALSILRAAGRI